MGPDLLQHPLRRADGSAVFSDHLYTVVAGVNGPVEVQRRDELPEEAALEVNVRPAAGVGGPRERWLETVVHAALRPLLLVHMHPRTLIQVTLQLTKEPALQLARSVADVALVPALFNAAFLAVLDGGLPLAVSASAVLGVVREDGKVVFAPSEKELVGCSSVHAIAYDNSGAQVLVESTGNFDFTQWDEIAARARDECSAALTEDASMDRAWLRQALLDRTEKALAWREKT